MSDIKVDKTKQREQLLEYVEGLLYCYSNKHPHQLFQDRVNDLYRTFKDEFEASEYNKFEKIIITQYLKKPLPADRFCPFANRHTDMCYAMKTFGRCLYWHKKDITQPIIALYKHPYGKHGNLYQVCLLQPGINNTIQCTAINDRKIDRKYIKFYSVISEDAASFLKA